jgi:hypothetical protein
MRFVLRIVLVGLIASANCLAQAKKTDAGTGTASAKLERMPESLEVRFALSAAPPHLRDAATVYVLDPAKGYVVNHRGTNGVGCIVVRSDWQFDDQAFRDDIAWAVCFDAEGSKTLMQDYFFAAEMRARGMDSKQVHTELLKKFGTAEYPNPARIGIAYMIAPVMRGFTNRPDPQTMNMPHYMFYAPNVKNSDIGGGGYGQYPFMLRMSPGRDDYIIMLVGEAEKAKILADSKQLTDDLCAYRKYMCTTAETRARTPVN